MLFFAIRRRGRPRSGRGAAPASLLLTTGSATTVWPRPIERALVGSGTSPTLLNFVGAGTGRGRVSFAYGRPALAAWVLALAGSATSSTGGWPARAVRLAAARFDSTLDRFAERRRSSGSPGFGESPWRPPPPRLALGGSLMVSCARARRGLGPVGGGLMQRPERMVLLILALLEPAAVGRLGGTRERADRCGRPPPVEQWDRDISHGARGASAGRSRRRRANE
jgi:hypothetical protein